MAPSLGIVVLFHFTSGIPHPSFKTGSVPSRRVTAFEMTTHFPDTSMERPARPDHKN